MSVKLSLKMFFFKNVSRILIYFFIIIDTKNVSIYRNSVQHPYELLEYKFHISLAIFQPK